MKLKKFKIGDINVFDESINVIKDHQTKVKILTRLQRLANGNRGDYKNIGGSLYELRIPTGKGWRVYYYDHGNEIILLMLTGNKATQSKDITKIKGWIKNGLI